MLTVHGVAGPTLALMVLLPAVGCVPLAIHQSPVPLAAGGRSVQIGMSVPFLSDPDEDPEILLSAVNVAARFGVSERVDTGIRTSLTDGVTGDVKVRLMQAGPVHVSSSSALGVSLVTASVFQSLLLGNETVYAAGRIGWTLGMEEERTARHLLLAVGGSARGGRSSDAGRLTAEVGALWGGKELDRVTGLYSFLGGRSEPLFILSVGYYQRLRDGQMAGPRRDFVWNEGYIAGSTRDPVIDANLRIPAAILASAPVCGGTLDPAAGAVDPAQPDSAALARCGRVMRAPADRAALLDATRKVHERVGVVAAVGAWSVPDPADDGPVQPNGVRLVALAFDAAATDADSLRALVTSGRVHVLDELSMQFGALRPADPAMAPFLELAAELGVPLRVGMGPGSLAAFPPAGTVAYGQPAGAWPRARPANPLLWEDVLAARPGVRLVIQQAGWPYLSEMLHLLAVYPDVYVDIGQIGWLLPRDEFWRYLKGLVDGGFGKRIMYASDASLWPEAVEMSVQRIRDAPFLTAEQRREILHDNAARFYGLGPVS